MPEREIIIRAIERSWDAFTSAHRRWTPENPPLGQSDVTALAINELLGGEIMRQTVVTEYGEQWQHFSNIVDDEVIDLTLAQYPESVEFVGEQQPIASEDIIVRYPVRMRYSLLQDSIQDLLSDYSRAC